MKELTTIARGVLVCAATAFLAMGSAEAQETDGGATGEEGVTPTEEAPITDSTTETGDDSVASAKIAAEFQDFLGENSESVVQGLRNGESFTLTETTPGETPDQPGTTTEVTIEPATGKMGYGNVRNSLQLSQFQLQQAGIDQPTASQLDASLNGGSVTNSEGTTTELQGVLALRSEGMGWGRIAQQYGTKVGWVKNGRASMTAPTSEGPGGESGDTGGEGPAPSGDTTSGEGAEAGVVGSSSEAGAGIVDAAGNAAGNRANAIGQGATRKSGARAVVTGTGAPSGTGRGQGVVTGLGKSSNGRGTGYGIVDGMGASSNGRGGSRVTTGLGSSSGSKGRGAGYGIVNGMGGSSNGRGGSAVTTGLGSSSGSNGRGAGYGIVNAAGASNSGRGGSRVTTGLGNSSGSKGRGWSRGNGGGNGRGNGRWK
jgi:hypothetical protein